MIETAGQTHGVDNFRQQSISVGRSETILENSKFSTLWLTIAFLDRDMEMNARLQILQALAEQKVEVRASFNYIQKPVRPNGLDKVWMLRLRVKGLLGKILLFIEQQLVLMKNLDVDVVVVWPFNLHQILPLWFLWRKVLRHRRPKFVLDVRTLAVELPRNWKGKQQQKRFDTSVRIAFRYFDGLTMITEKMKRDLQTEANNFKKKLCVWSTGVDPNLFDPDNVDDIRSELGFKDRFVIMYHGIISRNRGLQQAIEAIAMVRKSHPEVMFFLLGKGPAQNEIEEQVRNLGLGKHVIIHPPVPFEEVPKFIKSAQAGILPFPDLDWWNTSSPIKLNEYLAMGKPVIVTDIAAHRAALGKLKCGFFVPNHQPDSLARGIKTVMEKEPELAALGEIARKTAIERFTWERQAVKIKTYFQDLLKEDSVFIR
ncbi:MAG: glycosyltransferase family 4 protein [Pseudomonadota bacterium]